MKKYLLIILTINSILAKAQCDSTQFIKDVKQILNFAKTELPDSIVKNDPQYYKNFDRLLSLTEEKINFYKKCDNKSYLYSLAYLHQTFFVAFQRKSTFHLQNGEGVFFQNTWSIKEDSLNFHDFVLFEVYEYKRTDRTIGEYIGFNYDVFDDNYKLRSGKRYQDYFNTNFHYFSSIPLQHAHGGYLNLDDIKTTYNLKKTKYILIIISTLSILFLISLTVIIIIYKKIKRQKLEIDAVKNHLQEKNNEISDSINYAERIQRSLLASKELLTENLNEFFVLFKPKDIVSGDFYWATKLSNNNFALITADSTGHGIPGALMSILNISCIEKAIESEKLTDPNDIFNHTRIKVIETLKKDGSDDGGKDGMDASLICIDNTKSELIYSAANNPIWIVREKELIELKGDKMPIGKHDLDHIPFTKNIFKLNKHDIIYTLTDGFPDQFGGKKGKKFMYKQLKETLVSISSKPLLEQKETLNEILKTWMGDNEQVDDITIIGIRV